MAEAAGDSAGDKHGLAMALVCCKARRRFSCTASTGLFKSMLSTAGYLWKESQASACFSTYLYAVRGIIVLMRLCRWRRRCGGLRTVAVRCNALQRSVACRTWSGR